MSGELPENDQELFDILNGDSDCESLPCFDYDSDNDPLFEPCSSSESENEEVNPSIRRKKM